MKNTQNTKTKKSKPKTKTKKKKEFKQLPNGNYKLQYFFYENNYDCEQSPKKLNNTNYARNNYYLSVV